MAKTIKVIDLLNKIANGEDVPQLIEYNRENYIFQNKDYKNEDRDLYLFSEETPDITAILNNEVKIVEIIEEQQDIDIQTIKGLEYLEDYEVDKTDVRLNRELINKILQWAKQLDKNIKKE